MIRNAIRQFMYGRYGHDQLNLFLVITYFLCATAALFTQLTALYWLSVVFLFVSLFRMLSRNPVRRRAENTKFMNMVMPLIRWIKLRRTIRTDKEHRYFKCPNCSQQLRVPRGKGRITVTCRGCGASFEEKT